MSKNRSSAMKRDREQRKAEKLAEKRRRREERKLSNEQHPSDTPIENPLAAENFADIEVSTPDTAHGPRLFPPQL